MNTEQKEIVKKLMDLVIEHNCDTFNCWLDFSGHVNTISLRYQTPAHVEFVHICGVSSSPCHEHISGFIAAKEAHDELYAPENIAATQEATRLAKIAELQKQIEELS